MKLRRRRVSTASAQDSVAQPTTKYSTSPLIDPAVCGLVAIFSSQTGMRGNYRRNTEALIAASQSISVPMFVCCRDVSLVTNVAAHRTFSFEAYDCIWKNEAFREALDAANLSTLVLAGCWLDREVTVAALHALADCYDVYIPIDASPIRSRGAARLAEARLLQAGATPILTEQILHEWALETSNPAHRAALTALVE
jgi:hypothetical protein